MYDYFIRCTQVDYEAMIALGVKLGALVVSEDGNIVAPDGGWDAIGTIYKPTGNTIDTLDGQIPEMAPVLDPDGNPYFHANLRTPIHLGRKVKELAITDSAIAMALADQSKWFVTSEDGQVVAPKNPTRVWA